MNFKKLLLVTGILSIATPSSLSVVGCNINQAKSIINTIDEIGDLEIAVNLHDENKTVFDILNDPNSGIAEVISKREEVANDFKKELFKLDLENIYLDKNKNEKINQEQKVIIDTTYYFQYSYNNQKNNVLVAITIKNDEESLVVKKIDEVFVNNEGEGNLNIYINLNDKEKTSVFDILTNPNSGIAELIANHKDMAKVFNKELFKLDLENIYFMDKNKKVTEKDKITVNTDGSNIYYFQYSYKNTKNTTLVPIVIYLDTESLIVEGISEITYNQKINVNTTVDELKAKLNAEFIKSKLDSSKSTMFKDELFKLQELKKADKILTNDDLKQEGNQELKIIFSYGEIKNQETNLTINVVK